MAISSVRRLIDGAIPDIALSSDQNQRGQNNGADSALLTSALVPQQGAGTDRGARPATGRASICLAMIVRDEAQVIERCLSSVIGLIDYWVICDTGSIDGTPDLISNILAGVPGELHHRPWRNFGSNRTELMTLARGTADYLLLLDADMTIAQSAGIGDLSADAYLLRCGDDFEYWVPRLVRGDRPWTFTGATHEYLDSPRQYSSERHQALSVVHFADGGSRADKLPRDKALLEARLAQEPADERAVFYLAQTLRDMGRRDEAIELFLRRAGLGGFEEEAFYALYQAAVLTAEADPVAALPLFLDAWERRPSRAEPLYEIARIARDRGWHRLAHSMTSLGLGLPVPPDLLFVHSWIYDWGLRFEHGIACYWLDQHEAGIAANDELLSRPDLPPHVGAQALKNRSWCALELKRSGKQVPPLPPESVRFLSGSAPLLGELVTDVRFAEISLQAGSPWPLFNPSIAADGDGFRLIVRSASYERFVAGNYLPLTADGIIRTANYDVRLDAGFRVRSAEPIADDLAPRVPQAHIVGSEDCRLFCWQDDWWVSATRCDLDADGVCRMTLTRLRDGHFGRPEVLPPPVAGRHEKNWMPFVGGGDLYFVYSCHPFVVLRFDAHAGRLSEVTRTIVPPVMAGLRGGSQGVPVDGGYLFAVHEAHDELGERSYTHRLILMSDQFLPAGLSEPFSFTHGGIEFCAGAARAGDDLALSFGLNDRVAALAVAPLDQLISLVVPLHADAVSPDTNGDVLT